jgi:hypothetical protein
VAWTADHRGSTPPKSFFEGLPRELEEAAQIGGLGWFGIFVRIVLPLSKAVLATMILFYAVSTGMTGSLHSSTSTTTTSSRCRRQGVTVGADSRAAVRRWPSALNRGHRWVLLRHGL